MIEINWDINLMIEIYRQCQDNCGDVDAWHYYQMKIDILEERLDKEMVD